MGGIDHLGAGADGMDNLLRRVNDLETATPLASASVERGRIRMYAGSQLLIEDGNFTVSGTAEITGTLDGSGTFSWTGPVTFTGTTNLDGPVSITGAVTLGSTMSLTSAGKIVVGGMTFDTGGVSGTTVNISATSTLILQAPTKIMNGLLQASDVTVSGTLKNPGMPTISAAGKTPNVWQDPSTGILYRLI